MRSGVDASVVSTSQRDTIADDGYDAEVGGRVARGGCASGAVERGTEAADRRGELPTGESVSVVARRHGVHSRVWFRWRRRFRKPADTDS